MSGIHGWLLIDKPVGPTSAQVVGMLRRSLRDGGHGQMKTGHGGTLDPLASGLLPIAFGEATKLSGYLLNGVKAYRFRIRFGAETTTHDCEGTITARSDVRPNASEIAAVLGQFRGEILQVPPAHSALKVDGERAYRRARRGEAVALPPRGVTIHQLQLVATTADSATLDVRCSKGTYVRSLARDIARALGAHGHVALLQRTAAGGFRLADAMALDKARQLMQGPEPRQALLPLTAGLDDIPVLAVDAAQARALQQGQRVGCPPDTIGHSKSGQYLATHGSVAVALVRIADCQMQVTRGFHFD